MDRPLSPGPRPEPACALVALDIDGTLLTSARVISPRTRAAVHAARSAGVHLALVTGRRYPAARKVAAELAYDGIADGVPLVLHNGALVIVEGDVLLCRPLGAEVARRAIRLGRARACDPVLHCGRNGEGRLVLAPLSDPGSLLATYIDRSRADVTIVADIEGAVAEDPMQVMFGGPAEDMDALAGELRATLGPLARVERTSYPERGVGIVDVLAPGVGKDAALRFLAGHWGVPLEHTLAIGDNWNDCGMLRAAGRGLVMGNAERELRGMGFEVLPSNDEDGVAVALERYVLGGKKKRG